MKLILSIQIVILGLFIFVAPATVFAQTPTQPQLTPECQKLLEQIQNNDGGKYSGLASQLPKYCTEGDVYNRIIGFMYYIVGVAAVISIIYGGYTYMTAGSNDTRKTKGKNIIIYTIAGVVVAALAVVIINVVINLIVDNKFF